MDMLSRIKNSSQSKRYLKVLLSGDDGSGKTSSIIFGAEGPILMIDPERKSVDYKHLVNFDIFDSQNVLEILQVTQELLHLQRNGQELPYKTIAVDSATVLYKYCIAHTIEKIKAEEGLEEKHKLEPIEYQRPQKIFYDIINNLKELNVHMFVTSHVKDNFLKGGKMFQIDPNEPYKPDCEKRLPYEVSLHLMLRKVGRNRFKAERMRSNLLDKDRNHLIPPVIDNFDNNTLIEKVMDFANSNEGFKDEKSSQIQNVIRKNANVSNMADQIISFSQAMNMTSEDAVRELQKVVPDKQNPYDLSEQEAQSVLNHFGKLLETSGSAE